MASVRKIFIWILSGLALALFCLWIYLIYMSYTYRTEIATISGSFALAAQKETYLASVRSVIRSSSADIKSMQDRFVEEVDVPEFIDLLEGMAADIGIKADLGAIQLDPPEADYKFRVLNLHMTVSGSWGRTVSFIDALDGMPYASHIERVNLSKPSGDAGWVADIDLIQYVQ